ncbi:DUF4351 domain-containing protein [Nostoc sp.]|uniref:DUF4351 domain-containing protein n=1 Tax=Nostoc sp. TaxID=1180 RepID=UPI002FF6DDF6
MEVAEQRSAEERKDDQSLVLLLLEQRVGQLSQIESDACGGLRLRISTLSLEGLEALALLDFSSMADLTAWLKPRGGIIAGC